MQTSVVCGSVIFRLGQRKLLCQSVTVQFRQVAFSPAGYCSLRGRGNSATYYSSVHLRELQSASVWYGAERNFRHILSVAWRSVRKRKVRLPCVRGGRFSCQILSCPAVTCRFVQYPMVRGGEKYSSPNNSCFLAFCPASYESRVLRGGKKFSPTYLLSRTSVQYSSVQLSDVRGEEFQLLATS